MVAGAVARQAANAAAGKTASGIPKAAGKAAGGTAQKEGRFGNQIPSQERQNSAGNFLNKSESPDQNENGEQNNLSDEMNYTGKKETSDRNSFNFSNRGQNKKKGKTKTKLNIKNPKAVAIILILFVVVLVFIGAAAPSLVGSLTENADFSAIPIEVLETANKVGIARMLENGSMPSTFAEELTNNGVEVGYLDTNGTFIAGLRPSSENSIALANYSDTSQEEPDKSLVVRFKDQIIDSSSWSFFADTDPDLYNAVSDATNIRGVAYYDDLAQTFFSSIASYSRNAFSSYTYGDTSDFRDIISNYVTNKTSSSYEIIDSRCFDGNGNRLLNNPECKQTTGQNATNIESRDQKQEAITQYLDAVYNSTIVDCDSTTQESELEICDNVQAAIITYLVNSAVNASESQEAQTYFLSIQEVASKTKAGDGAKAPINEMLNFLTTKDENGISAVQSPTLSALLTKSFTNYTGERSTTYSLDRVQDIIGELITDFDSSIAIALETTATEIASFNNKSTSMLKTLQEVEDPGPEPEAPSNNDVEKYKSLCTEDEKTAPEGTTPNSCISYEAAKIAYDAAMTAYDINHKAWAQQKEAYDKYQEYADINNGKHETTKKAINQLSKILATDSTTYLEKENYKSIIGLQAGEIFSKGGAITESKISTFTMGGTPGTQEAVVAYQKEIDKTAELRARAERQEKSPFDISSQNTFLGSIVHSFSAYFYTTPSLLSSFSTFSTFLNQSSSSIIPGVFADNNSSFYTTYGNCPESNSTFVCSVFSSPTVVFDLDAIANIDPDSLSEPDELYKTVINERQLGTGYTSHEIAELIWNSEDTADQLASLLKQGATFVGNKIIQWFSKETRKADYFSTYYKRFTEEQMAIITGEAFINDKSNNKLAAYQSYIITDRLLDSIGYYDKDNTNHNQYAKAFIPGTGESTYLASLKNYNQRINNLSDAEYLAKISGLSVKEANLVLGYIAYNSYLASIDHDSALAFGGEDTFNLETSNQSESTTQLAIFNSEAKTIDNSSKRREITYVA